MSAESKELPQQPKLDPGDQSDRELSEEELAQASGGVGQKIYQPHNISCSAFQNFDQESNQLFNILSTVLKSEKELESGIKRSLG